MPTHSQRLQPIPSTALDAATNERIRGKVYQLAQRLGLAHSDLPDLEQDLTIHVWKRLNRYDPERQPDRAVFVRMLVGHATATVLRDRSRRVRYAHRSLDSLLRRGVLPEPLDPYPWPGSAEGPGLAVDIESVLATLPGRLRRVVDALRTNSVTAAARQLKMSRAAVYRRLEELRAAFAAAGLEDYFCEARTPRA